MKDDTTATQSVPFEIHLQDGNSVNALLAGCQLSHFLRSPYAINNNLSTISQVQN